MVIIVLIIDYNGRNHCTNIIKHISYKALRLNGLSFSFGVKRPQSGLKTHKLTLFYHT